MMKSEKRKLHISMVNNLVKLINNTGILFKIKQTPKQIIFSKKKFDINSPLLLDILYHKLIEELT